MLWSKKSKVLIIFKKSVGKPEYSTTNYETIVKQLNSASDEDLTSLDNHYNNGWRAFHKYGTTNTFVASLLGNSKHHTRKYFFLNEESLSEKYGNDNNTVLHHLFSNKALVTQLNTNMGNEYSLTVTDQKVVEEFQTLYAALQEADREPFKQFASLCQIPTQKQPETKQPETKQPETKQAESQQQPSANQADTNKQ